MSAKTTENVHSFDVSKASNGNGEREKEKFMCEQKTGKQQ